MWASTHFDACLLSSVSTKTLRCLPALCRLRRFDLNGIIELNEIFQLIKINMIVLKTTQDRVLAVLQTVAGILERRHTLPILANVLIRRTAQVDPLLSQMSPPAIEVPARHGAEVFTSLARPMAKLKHVLGLNLPRTSYFSSKVNGRNAP